MKHELNTIVEPRDQQRFLVCSCGAKVSLGWFPSAERQLSASMDHLNAVLEASGQATVSSVPVQDVPLDKPKLRMSWVNDAGEEAEDVQPELYQSERQKRALTALRDALDSLRGFDEVIEELAIDPLVGAVANSAYDAMELVTTATVAIMQAIEAIK